MLFRFLDRWGLLARRHVTARVRALACKGDDLAWGERGSEERGSWVWEARFTLSKRSSVSSPRMGASRTGQNRGMPQILSSEELNVLTVLNEVFPEKLNLHELAPRTELEPGSARLLSIVDGLLVRGLIEGKSLRGPEGLADAANLRITGAGTAAVEKSEVEYAAQPTRVPLKPVQASVLNVLIASPSDVGPERDAVESAIHEWNANHYVRTGTMLHPVRWETHSFPSAGDRPQGLLNRQIVESAHFLIAIFGCRLGTPTGEADSGTLEEIEQFRATGRYVALYFSSAPVARNADRAQLAALEKYQRDRQRDTLYATYGSAEDLRRLVTKHLPKIVAEVEATMRTGSVIQPAIPDMGLPETALLRRRRSRVRAMSIEEVGDLSPKEIELLWNAAKDPDEDLLHSETFDGEGLRTNGKNFLENADKRTAAEWLAAFRGLEDRGLIEPLGEERSFFKVTGEGYAVADELDEFDQWDISSVVLHAYYMNANSEEVTLSCKRVVAIPAKYYADQVGADRTVMRSVKEGRSLLVEGVSPQPSISWTPTDVDFIEDSSGRSESFRVEGMTFIRSGTLKFQISG